MQNVDTKNQRVSFTGQKTVMTECGSQRFAFYLPPYDKKDGVSLALELVPVREGKDSNGRPTLVQSGKPVLVDDSITPLNKYNYFALNNDKLEELLQKADTDKIGYRFVFINNAESNTQKAKTGKYLLDSGAVAEGEDGKFSYFSKRHGSTNMRGVAINTFADVILSSEAQKQNEDFVRSAFNKAGGTIAGLNAELRKPNGLFEPFDVIQLSPLFNGDDISAIGYWTANPFQITSTLGTLEDYKEFTKNVFDTGKHYIADGAFTSFSFQSPQMQSILKWGKESPYYNWVKISPSDAPNGKLQLGILPDGILSSSSNDKGNAPSPAEYVKSELLKEQVAFKVVNPKYIEKDAINRLNYTEKDKVENLTLGNVIKNPDYDKNKPTYIQFIDKRLADDKQLNDTKNLTLKYANHTTNNHYDVSNSADSVQPFYFQVNPDDPKFMTKGATLEALEKVGYIGKDGKVQKGYESFFEAGHYKITRKGENGGANNWDGNVDLFKANISTPSSDPADRIGNKQVKNQYYSVATYWTKLTDDTMLEHLAQNIANDEETAFNNIAERYDIDDNEFDNIIDAIDTEEFNENFEKRIGADTEKVLTKAVADFPLETIQFAPDLTAVLSSPFITPRPIDVNDDEKLSKSDRLLNKELSQKIPKNIQHLYNDSMKEYLVSVLRQFDSKMPAEQKLFEGGSIDKLSTYGKAVVSLIANDVMQYGTVKALFPDANVDFKDGKINYDYNLRYKGVVSLGVGKNFVSPKEEAEAVLAKMDKGFKNLANSNNNDLVNFLYKRFENVALDDIKIARAIVDKTGSGLNWRFDAAKDVADLDKRRDQNSHVTFETCWNNVIDFWGTFIKNIKQVNPSSYTIAEITDLWSFAKIQASNKNNLANEAVNNFNKMNRQEQEHALLKFFQNDARAIFANDHGTTYNSRQILNSLSADAQSVIKGNVSNLSENVFNELKSCYTDANKRDVLRDALWVKDFGEFINPEIAEKIFYDRTGADGSDYTYCYRNFYQLFGFDPEAAEIGWDMNGNRRLYNMKAFQSSIVDYLKSGSSQFAKQKQVFLSNQDKQRPLHTIALDVPLFLSDFNDNLLTENNESYESKQAKVAEFKQAAIDVIGGQNELNKAGGLNNISSMGVAVGKKYLEIFDSAINKLNASGMNITNDERNIIKQAIRDLSAGKFLSDDYNLDVSKGFGAQPFDITMTDVMRQARYIAEKQDIEWKFSQGKGSEDVKLSATEKKIVDKTFDEFEPDLKKMAQMIKTMMFSVGLPTIFAGDQFGQSGYERPAKNIILAMRDIIHTNWAVDDNRKVIQDLYNEVTAAAKLHRTMGLSALAGGDSLVVPQTNDGHTALFKYDDKGSNVLVVYSNGRMDTYSPDKNKDNNIIRKHAQKPLKNEAEKVDSIDIGYIDPQQGDNVMGNIAEEGAEFKRLKYDSKSGKYIKDENNSYIVKNGKLTCKKQSVGPQGFTDGTIELGDVANVFYRVNGNNAA